MIIADCGVIEQIKVYVSKCIMKQKERKTGKGTNENKTKKMKTNYTYPICIVAI